ncbi:MAG: hypothetical protein ACRC92_11420 [Peptostreptococcaceae bacterium]
MNLEDEIKRMSMGTMAIFNDDFLSMKESFKSYLGELDNKASTLNLALMRTDNGVRMYEYGSGRDVIEKICVSNFFAKKIKPNSAISSIRDANYGEDFFYFTKDTLMLVIYDRMNQIYDVTISSKYDTDIFEKNVKEFFLVRRG